MNSEQWWANGVNTEGNNEKWGAGVDGNPGVRHKEETDSNSNRK